MNTESDRGAEFWKGKEPYLGAKGSTTPTFWSHGFFDANTKPQHLDVWSSLKGPKQAWFGQYTHLRGHEAGVGREGFNDEAFRFLDRHVRGLRTKKDAPVTVQSGNGAGRWRAEAVWPPADAKRWAMPVRAGSYVDEPGNSGDGSSAGNGHWSVTRPLPGAAHLAGEVLLKADVTTTVPGAQVVAHVYDVDDTGTATLVTRGAATAPATGAQKVAYALYPQDWVFGKGQPHGGAPVRRGRLLVHAGDDAGGGHRHRRVGVLPAAADGAQALPRGRPERRGARDAALRGGRGHPAGGDREGPAAEAEGLAAGAGVDGRPRPRRRARRRRAPRARRSGTSVSRQTTEMRISEVLIASALMLPLASASKKVAVTPGWLFMPAPTSDTLPMCSSDSSDSKPTDACSFDSALIAVGQVALGQREADVGRSLAPETFCTIMSMLTSASATARKMAAASPGLSGTPTTVTRASDRSCATPLMMACSTGSPVIRVPGLLEKDDRTTSGTS
jgi:hypothetical protein